MPIWLRRSVPGSKADIGHSRLAGKDASGRRYFGSAAKSARSNNQEMAKPESNPQKAAPTFNNGTSATVTRKATSAPREKRSLNAVTKAVCKTRNIARPAKAVTRDLGAMRSSRVKGRRKQSKQYRKKSDKYPRGILAFALAAGDNDGIGRPCQACADAADNGADRRADATGNRYRINWRRMTRRLENRKALTVLHGEDGNCERHDKFDHGRG